MNNATHPSFREVTAATVHGREKRENNRPDNAKEENCCAHKDISITVSRKSHGREGREKRE